MKKRALAFFILGVAVVVSLGIVYIDTVQNFWSVSGGFVRLTVSNTVSTITISTNTPHGFGYNTNNTARSFAVTGRKPATVATGNGTTAAIPGGIAIVGGEGGDTLATTSAGAGIGGTVSIVGGAGGNAASAVTNATAANGGVLNLVGGEGGGSVAGVATNATTAGNGGAVNVMAGNGGVPVTASTNTTGGNGGAFAFSTGIGGTPAAGFTRQGGNGGNGTFTANSGGDSTRITSGSGGNMSFVAGNSGSVLVTPGSAAAAGALNFTAGNSGSAVAGGNPSPGGNVNFLAGDGSTGDTNSNGGRIHLLGGSPGSGAVAGDVVVARNSAGTSRGGLMVGPLTANAGSLTNLLQATATLDFGSIGAGNVADLPITVVNAADGDVVSLAVPIASVTNCVWNARASNGVVYVRAANTQLVSAQDPNSGVFRVSVSKFR